jgi:hypothetical protein
VLGRHSCGSNGRADDSDRSTDDSADVRSAALAAACFNFDKAVAPDGHDVLEDENGRQAGSAWRIIGVTPPSGAGVDEGQPIVLTVEPA